MSTHQFQDGATAYEVAEAHGHQKVCEELRKDMHGSRRPLSEVSIYVGICCLVHQIVLLNFLLHAVLV